MKCQNLFSMEKNIECHLLQILLGAKHYLTKCNVNLFQWSAHSLRFLCKKHKLINKSVVEIMIACVISLEKLELC